MNVSVLNIKDVGLLSSERIVLNVTQNCNIGDYMLAVSVSNERFVSTRLRKTFWFPDKIVRAGDIVVLYTKEGVDSEKMLGNDRKSHFFYWSQSDSLFNKEEKSCAVLFEMKAYQVKDC